MRKMGIDFGTKKVGIALSDEAGKLAFPREVLQNDTNLLEKIMNIINSESVQEVVIGHSIDTKGEENPVHERVKEFITNLTLQMPLPTNLEPEQFSTQQAVKSQGRNDQTDASAAALILQSHLDKQKSTSTFEELNE